MKIKFILGVLILLLLNACSSKSNFYQLHPNTAADKSSSRSIRHTVIGVAEVEVAGYLNKPEMVTRLTQGRIVVHDLERWADAFPKNIQSVLKDNLSTLLPKYTFLSIPWEEPLDDSYRIYVTVNRFDGDSTGLVTFKGRWSLVHKDDNRVVLSQSLRISEQGGETLDDIVSTQSRLLDKLSRQIVSKIQNLDRNSF